MKTVLRESRPTDGTLVFLQALSRACKLAVRLSVFESPTQGPVMEKLRHARCEK